MTRDEENELKNLQKQCARALALYTDLTEAVCEILTQSTTAPLTAADRARLRALRQQEMSALKAYLAARLNLMTALSLDALPAYRKFYNAVNSADRPRSRAHARDPVRMLTPCRVR